MLFNQQTSTVTATKSTKSLTLLVKFMIFIFAQRQESKSRSGGGGGVWGRGAAPAEKFPKTEWESVQPLHAPNTEKDYLLMIWQALNRLKNM